MPSHLTRLVFRSIIADEPLLYRGCRLRAVRPHLVNRTARVLPHIQRRTFLDLFKQRRKVKPMKIPAGLETLSEVGYKTEHGLRPPEPKVVAEAFKVYFAQRKGTFEEFHIGKAFPAFVYLLDNPKPDGTPWLSATELSDHVYFKMLKTEARSRGDAKVHIMFGKALIEEYARLMKLDPTDTGGDASLPLEDNLNVKKVRLLSALGAAKEARDIAMSSYKYEPTSPPEYLRLVRKVWGIVLAGIVREGNIDEVRRTTEIIEQQSIPMDAKMQENLVNFFCEKKAMDDVKFWYKFPITEGDKVAKPGTLALAALLRACALVGDLTYGQQVVTSLLQNDVPQKGAWDAIFLWSAAIGKGVDEVDRMMSVMIRRNDEARNKDRSIQLIRPDVDTINMLVDFANSKKDPYSAERYIALGEKRGIMPDEKTYAMQIKYRLSVNDIDGARAAYFNLQGEFSGAEESVAVVNQLIRALCESQQHLFDELMVMVDDLHERKALFDPETIAALCVLHLKRGEAIDALDLLQTHAHSYTPEQRTHIRKGLAAFVLDGDTSTADAWETYQILRQVFQETPRADRIELMNAFFTRKRSDMACHVFFHMRNHVVPEIRADADVYVAAFAGFARNADAESLELAHNQLKLDLTVDFNTRLRNALMLAYGATEQNLKAMRFWREICESKEGPSYNSIPIVFRACETMHYGWGHARSIWKRLKEQDVEIDRNIWKAYMCAMARNSQHDEVQNMIENVEEEYGFILDLDILGNWFNCTANIERQARVEKWIKERYPDIWRELEALGHWVTMDGFGHRQFNINRDLEP
ncbi:hypothetical protein HBI81_146710 [Parastagonospora nodorum]|nr:hypothetical protein HBI81_146710 [Parastagonospora nodorum]